MEPVRLIAMDMDGTLLLPYQQGVGRIAPECIRALHDARDAGIALVIASGRMVDDAGFFALDMALPDMYILGSNGACCLDRPLGPVTQEHVIPADAAREILSLLMRHDIEFGVFAPFDLYVSMPAVSPEEIAHHWGTYILREGGRCRVHAGLQGLDAACPAHVNKFYVRCPAGESVLRPLRQELERRFPALEITSSWVNNLEINPSGVNKGSAVEGLAHRLGIPMRQVMAIGDNDNDLPMLERAGFAVAMGNSVPSVLRRASYLTLSNARHGVAEAIRALALHQPSENVRSLHHE